MASSSLPQTRLVVPKRKPIQQKRVFWYGRFRKTAEKRNKRILVSSDESSSSETPSPSEERILMAANYASDSESSTGSSTFPSKKRKIGKQTSVYDETPVKKLSSQKLLNAQVTGADEAASVASNGPCLEADDEVSLMRTVMSGGDHGDFLVKYGPIMIDKNGFVLGQFNYLNDGLSICH